MKHCTLIDATGTPYASPTPGTVGGHRATHTYGRLDCPSALRAIERGGYVTQRVFFVDEATAIAAGFRPCARCLPDRYRDWTKRAYASARDASRACITADTRDPAPA